ncbi:ABC transporter ATP-binding protein [Prochlorococcus sp. MIT 1300]|uniref:ABC transporter ATP-binding protein n=1 Tax=Prochlorococcus sp. MIT 1300 TaxID=3096218 RepID=UPI002A7564B8|nr:ABC transporter ATP-binding protein [Prochlorococcus sp. MIT 1300]
MTLILKNLGRKVGSSWILKDINLQIDNGECVALLGPSGCGKSSTLRLIAGLDKPDRGQIFLDGNEITKISPVERRIGMVFQSYALYPHLTIASNLSLGLRVRGLSSAQQRQRVSTVLQLMRLEGLANRKPAQLSGGQRQRVALARALLRDPRVYLLDEPMSNLDAQLREDLRPELRNLILSEGKQPVLYVTHDQQEAMAMSNRIAVLNEGLIEQVGTPKELYKNPNTIFVASFIGRPQINFLPSEVGIIKAIRPEHLEIRQDGIQCQVIYREWLGTTQLLIIQGKLGKLRLLCSSQTHIGDNIKVGWSHENEHHFDANSGIRSL